MLLNFVKLGGLQLSGVEIIWEGIFLGIDFPCGNCPRSYPGWEFCLVGVFRVGIVQWESPGWQFAG